MGSYLGQNFLSSQRAIQSIVKLIQDLKNQTGATACVEIGPGKGAITKHIHQLFEHFVVIEKDPKMIDVLENTLPSVKSIHTDALEFAYEDLEHILQTQKNQTLIVGNLPYYITSPLLRTFLEPGDKTEKQRA
jgi:16S rRNA A1518/A1519 N6-dimethyltransferase RsmA/KsgA/DIM1 with predicted DNA glycosylase/AP lyase activity